MYLIDPRPLRAIATERMQPRRSQPLATNPTRRR